VSPLDWLGSLETTSPLGTITATRTGACAELTLDHDRARNSLTTKMMGEFVAIVDEWVANPPVVWTLRARGRAFCAGGHLGDVRAHLGTPEAGHRMATVMGEAVQRLATLPALGIVVVEGAAVGGGAELALCGDVCIMDVDARLSFVQAQRGVAPGWGGASRLVDRVGKTQALRILLTSPIVSAAEAEALGIAVCATDVNAQVTAMVDAVLALEPEVVRAVVSQVRGTATEPEAFSTVWGSTGHLARLAGLPWGRS
jgi:enoyl-CoA hydratase/carnithine racemase